MCFCHITICSSHRPFLSCIFGFLLIDFSRFTRCPSQFDWCSTRPMNKFNLFSLNLSWQWWEINKNCFCVILVIGNTISNYVLHAQLKDERLLRERMCILNHLFCVTREGKVPAHKKSLFLQYLHNDSYDPRNHSIFVKFNIEFSGLHLIQIVQWRNKKVLADMRSTLNRILTLEFGISTDFLCTTLRKLWPTPKPLDAHRARSHLQSTAVKNILQLG